MKEQSFDTLQDRKEEYLAAKRAAVEAMDVGQETLAASARQREQLVNAERMADQTQFALDKSSRMLRGMTWSGWLANLMSKNVNEEDYFTKRRIATDDLETGLHYDDVPSKAQAAAQAIQNYHCNLQVLAVCETDDQRQMCRTVCNQMYESASSEISKLQKANAEEESVSSTVMQRFLKDLSRLRERQRYYEATSQKKQPIKSTPKKSTSSSVASNSPEVDAILEEQDEHLEFLSHNLGELHSIAHSLNESVSEQNKVIDSLDEKTDEITDKSRMVTRRADRLIQKKSWTPAKKTFYGLVRILHIETGLCVANDNGTLILADKDKRHPESCLFGLWKRQGDIFGLQNQFSDRWMGQTLLGSLACTSTKFGARDEWQADQGWESTRLICASAGWGHGGYLLVRKPDGLLYIGKSEPEIKKQADMWRVEEVEESTSIAS